MERLLSRHHLVQHAAERKQIGPGIGVEAHELLGRHVMKRSEDRAWCREIGRLAAAVCASECRGRLSKPEIEELGQWRGGRTCARRRQHDVARFEIAMNDAALVRPVECRGNLGGDVQGLGRRKRPAQEPCRQRLALEKLHDQEIDAAMAADVVHGADVWMVQRGNRARLTLEPFTRQLVGGVLRGHHLDRHRAIEARIASPVHVAHASATDQGAQVIRSDSLAGEVRRPSGASQVYRRCFEKRRRVFVGREQAHHLIVDGLLASTRLGNESAPPLRRVRQCGFEDLPDSSPVVAAVDRHDR